MRKKLIWTLYAIQKQFAYCLEILFYLNNFRLVKLVLNWLFQHSINTNKNQMNISLNFNRLNEVFI